MPLRLNPFRDPTSDPSSDPFWDPFWADLFRKKKPDQDTLFQQLKDNILFCTLSKKELEYLAGSVYERLYQPGEIIFQQNDRGLGMYLILQGKIGIQSESAQGDAWVATLEEGSIFGEVALVEPDSRRTATVVALEKARILGFFKPDLMKILESKPTMGVKILLQLSMILGKRLTLTTAKIAELLKKQADDIAHSNITTDKDGTGSDEQAA